MWSTLIHDFWEPTSSALSVPDWHLVPPLRMRWIFSAKMFNFESRKCTGYFSLNQPTWKMKMKIKRMKRKMRETVKSAEWRVEEYQDNNTMRIIHGWRARKTLEPMSRATLKCVLWNTRKCDVWGCSVHTPRRLQQIAISCKRSDYNLENRQNSTLSILMSERPKQVSLFFEAAHFMSSEVIDIL